MNWLTPFVRWLTGDSPDTTPPSPPPPPTPPEPDASANQDIPDIPQPDAPAPSPAHGIIQGRVNGGEGLILQLHRAGALLAQGKLGRSGAFRLRNLDAGAYTLLVLREGDPAPLISAGPLTVAGADPVQVELSMPDGRGQDGDPAGGVMAQLPRFISINGRLVPPDAATVSVFNPAIYGAFGVYESMQMRDGVIFHFEDHLERLITSARLISLPLAGDAATIAGWTEAMIDAHRSPPSPPTLGGTVDGVLPQRWGPGGMTATIRLFAVGASSPDEPPQTFIWLQALARPKPDDYVNGLGAVTYPGERAIPQSKSLNTLVNTLAKHKATAAGENEGLLVDRQGNVAEGGSSNLFVVQDGSLILPPDETILAGVTSQIVLMLAAQNGIPVERRLIPLASLAQWDEAFLTSTSRHVLPLVRVDGAAVGAGVPGPITQALTQQFDQYFAEYVRERRKESLT